MTPTNHLLGENWSGGTSPTTLLGRCFSNYTLPINPRTRKTTHLVLLANLPNGKAAEQNLCATCVMLDCSNLHSIDLLPCCCHKAIEIPDCCLICNLGVHYALTPLHIEPSINFKNPRVCPLCGAHREPQGTRQTTMSTNNSHESLQLAASKKNQPCHHQWLPN